MQNQAYQQLPSSRLCPVSDSWSDNTAGPLATLTISDPNGGPGSEMTITLPLSSIRPAGKTHRPTLPLSPKALAQPEQPGRTARNNTDTTRTAQGGKQVIGQRDPVADGRVCNLFPNCDGDGGTGLGGGGTNPDETPNSVVRRRRT